MPEAKPKLRKIDSVKALEGAVTENSGKFAAFVKSLLVDGPTDELNS